MGGLTTTGAVLGAAIAGALLGWWARSMLARAEAEIDRPRSLWKPPEVDTSDWDYGELRDVVAVFPVGPTEDCAHEVEPNRVHEPEPECWLCQHGICVQSLVGDGVILHGTWAGD